MTNETVRIRSAVAQVSSCSDEQLLARVQQLAAARRSVVTELLIALAEIDERQLYARFATSSMFAFCVDKLGLSEPSAYRYIAAARLARNVPQALALLRQGKVHLSGLALLSKYVDEQNGAELLSLAAGRSKRAIERLLAERFPQPDVPSSIRKLPRPKSVRAGAPESMQSSAAPNATNGGQTAPQVPEAPVSSAGARAFGPSRRPSVQPVSARSYRVQFTAGAEFVDKLAQAKALLGHQLSGSVAELGQLLELALDALIAERMKKKLALSARASRPRAKGAGADHTDETSLLAPSAALRTARRSKTSRDRNRTNPEPACIGLRRTDPCWARAQSWSAGPERAPPAGDRG